MDYRLYRGRMAQHYWPNKVDKITDNFMIISHLPLARSRNPKVCISIIIICAHLSKCDITTTNRDSSLDHTT